MRTNNQLKFNNLREQYPVFYFDAFQYSITKSEIDIQFFYHTQEIHFAPKISIQFGNYLLQTLSKDDIDGLLLDRKSVVLGNSVDIGGRRFI